MDIINGTPGNELKCDNRKLVTTYLRVGFDDDGAWRTFGLRKDFHPAVKVQMEDDITASAVVPAGVLENLPEGTDKNLSLKFAQNCEQRLFQRPDDAIHRGYDKQAEHDFVQPENFFSNYEPLTPAERQGHGRGRAGLLPVHRADAEIRARSRRDRPAGLFRLHRQPAPRGRQADEKSALPAKTSRPRPRRAKRIWRKFPRACAAACRRASRCTRPSPPCCRAAATIRPKPASARWRATTRFTFLELPELFMEVICSMTGKSPSTTGAGSEALLGEGE